MHLGLHELFIVAFYISLSVRRCTRRALKLDAIVKPYSGGVGVKLMFICLDMKAALEWVIKMKPS